LRSINRNVMLLQQFLPTIRQILSKFFIFQQDSAPAHGALEAINFFLIIVPYVVLLYKFFQNRLSNKFVVK